MKDHMDASERFLSRYTDRYCYLGGTTNTQSGSQTAPSAASAPYLQDVLQQAQSLNNQGMTYAPFSTVAPINPVTQQAMDATQQYATSDNPITDAANASNTAMSNGQGAGQGTLSNIANGGNPNPYLQSMYNASAPLIENSVNAQFGMGGRTGSTANQQDMQQQLQNYAGNLFGANYNQAQGNQISAANALDSSQQAANSLSPTLANQQYTNLSALGSVGTQYQNQAQAQLQDLLTRYQFNQQAPLNLLQQYSNITQGLSPQLGGTTSSSGTTNNNNPASSIAASGSLLSGIGSLFSSGSNGISAIQGLSNLFS